MGNPNKQSASEAGRISVGLMNEYSALGRRAVSGVTNYATKALDMGLPSYVNRGYTSAGTAALEQALTESQGSRRVLANVSGEALGTYVPAITGAAGALAKTQAGLELSRAGATISQRDQLLKTLVGQGTQSVNLAAGFGGLQNRALAAGLDRGNPTYEAVVGGGSFASALLANLLQQRNTNPYGAAIAPGGEAGSPNWQGLSGNMQT